MSNAGALFGAVVGIALVTVTAVAVLVTPEGKPSSTLSDRINAACSKPGYIVADWSPGDEYNPVPDGTVEVTCQQANPPFKTYKVAVQR